MTTSLCLHGHDLYVTTADNTDDPSCGGCLLHTESTSPAPPSTRRGSNLARGNFTSEVNSSGQARRIHS